MMMRTLKHLAVAASFSLAAMASAQAATYPIGTSYNTDVFVAPSTGFFENVYTISLSSAGSVSYSLTELYESAALNLNLLNIGFYNSLLNPVSSSSLSAGTYSLVVTGKSVGTAGGVYNLQFNVSAVPEPETTAMMMFGLMALGAVAYRKKQS